MLICYILKKKQKNDFTIASKRSQNIAFIDWNIAIRIWGTRSILGVLFISFLMLQTKINDKERRTLVLCSISLKNVRVRFFFVRYSYMAITDETDVCFCSAVSLVLFATHRCLSLSRSFGGVFSTF